MPSSDISEIVDHDTRFVAASDTFAVTVTLVLARSQEEAECYGLIVKLLVVPRRREEMIRLLKERSRYAGVFQLRCSQRLC
jgi:hypothetical protein